MFQEHKKKGSMSCSVRHIETQPAGEVNSQESQAAIKTERWCRHGRRCQARQREERPIAALINGITAWCQWLDKNRRKCRCPLMFFLVLLEIPSVPVTPKTAVNGEFWDEIYFNNGHQRWKEPHSVSLSLWKENWSISVGSYLTHNTKSGQEKITFLNFAFFWFIL